MENRAAANDVQASSPLSAHNGASHTHNSDTTFEPHFSVADLAAQWRLGRETVRLLVKDEPGVLRIRLGRRKALTRYSVPESVARRIHTRLFHPAT